MRKAIVQLFCGNLFSKVFGLGREILTAALFGTGQVIGAYRVAQTGTFVPVNFFTSDSLNAAFIPLYKRYMSESLAKAQTLFWSLFALFLVLSILLACGLWWLSSAWIGVLAPGLDPHGAMLASGILRIMGLGVPFYLLGALLMYFSMANNDFIPMAARASIQNIGLIAGVVAAFLLHNVLFFAWGFTGSYILFFLWTIIRPIRTGYLALPASFVRIDIGLVMREFWRTLRPLLFLPVLLQGNIAIERAVATMISLSAVSALDYARFLSTTIIILISTPIGIVGLSSWSNMSAAAIRLHMQKVLRTMLLVTVPVSAFLAAHADLVVRILYSRGAFVADSVHSTTAILFGMSLGLWAQSIGYVFIKGLNAQLRNRDVLILMAFSLMVNVAINLALYPYLGALTLGLGNAAFGIVLLAGTLGKLKLWRNAWSYAWPIALGVGGYLILNIWVPLPKNKWVGLVTAGAFASIYWLIWVGAVPRLRRTAFEVIGLDRR